MLNKSLAAIWICLASLFALSGCDQARQQLASAIQPKTPETALQNATALYGSRQYQQAIDEGKPFVTTEGPYQHQLALLLARAYARSGNADQAMTYLTIAAQAGALDRPALMLDDDFVVLFSDARFIAFVGGSAASSANVTGVPVAPTSAASTGGVSAQAGPNGVSASAGGVSVRISP